MASEVTDIRRTAFIIAVNPALQVLCDSYSLDREGDRRFLGAEDREVVHEGGFVAARRLANRLLEGSPTRFFQLFRMNKDTFWKLLEWLETYTAFKGTYYQSVAQKLMIFLWIVRLRPGPKAIVQSEGEK
ncbi:uncharacterized protein BCR38DRAFT_430633 [Pseudomassariella vexata]|uniref:DUF8040 domain-containing protein n=1 Tax=Pseudomassariella vexata TaxID=1141098 RepID=A0A1Y2E4S5_9PEZI|nr:uncharacterized protein BCR38DRAFT_430633 [Pseudomassariella vexata]ORY66560.1 hypothetical protein BCR38DRAFT_430633 [Pseudomassariella vexata]